MRPFVVVAACAALGMGCAPRSADVRVDDLSVVVLVLDAAGARHLGAYGNARDTSPEIDALARTGGTLFGRAYAQSAWTLPSTASLLTGRYPRRRDQKRTRLGVDPIAAVLRRAGLRTAAFSENPYVTATYGFDQGFEEFHEYFPDALLKRNPRFYTTDSARPTSDAIAWLEAHAAERTFLYLHLLTPHSPYQPPPPFAGRFDPDYAGPLDGVTDTLLRLNEGTLTASSRDLEHLRRRYEENLAFGDHQVGRVLEALRRTGVLDRTVIVVTADHGEAFREHGVMLHTTTLFEEMIHVPLIVRLPPRFGALPARFDGIVELRDVVPTLCDALRVSCPTGTTRSLLRRVQRRHPDPGTARTWTSGGRELALGSIVTPDRKLIVDLLARRMTLFDLTADPEERHDLAADEPIRTHRLARRLHAPRPPVATPPSPAPDPGRLERLRALGYEE